jgi:hypothetical protein
MSKQQSKQQLIEQFNHQTIGKQALGQLRRIVLCEVLNDLASLPPDAAVKMLDKNRSKIDLAKLAVKVGYKTSATTIRQSFKKEVKQVEKGLREKKIIVSEEKSRSEQKDDNVAGFLEFINARLNEPDYEWPMNLKGALYRRAIWAFYTDTPLDDVEYPAAILSRDKLIVPMLADIDVKIASNEVKTIDFSALSSIDEMKNTMESKAISQLRKELKTAKNKLVVEREARLSIKQELAELKSSNKRLLFGDTTAFKGTH